MISFQSLDEVLKTTLRWEQRLKDFYDVAEIALQNDESKHVIALLRSKVEEKLEVLKKVRPEHYGQTAWIRYLADYDEDDLIGKGDINRTSGPVELFTHLATYEGKLKSFYAEVADKLTNQGQKELFESLSRFKSEQVDELHRLMKAHGDG